MICQRCRRRFGKPGENYWAVKHGLCSSCKENLISSSTRSHVDSEKKLG